MDYCLPCFGKSSHQTDEREPLLSKDAQRSRHQSQRGAHPVERGTADKIVDILAAFNAGKLPSQVQLSRFLQNLLKSELLKEDGTKIISSVGPMSEEGRKVLGDVRNLVQAILQFGLEKNDDDKLQEIYFQLLQTPLYQAGEATINAIKEGGAELNDQAPNQDELAFDTGTFLSALRTLAETLLTSSDFRLILGDLFAIIRDLVAHAAADIEQAGFQMQQAAEDVEERAQEDDNPVTPELDINETINSLKDQGHQAVDAVENAAKDIKNEWKGVGDDVVDKTKQKLLERIKQVISRAQRDVASRSAMRAILVLAQKYADRIASGTNIAASAVIDVAEKASQSFSKNESSTSSGHPPKPYPPQSPELNVDPHATLLQDMKEVLERLGKGHALDGLLVALKKMIDDLNEVPVVLADEINEEFKDKTEFVEVGRAQPVKSKGKNKKRGRKKGPSSDKQKWSEDDYPLSPAESKVSITSSMQAKSKSPLRAYFARIGAYLDRGLDDPGWVMSKGGAEILEGLFDDGIELVGVVGESVVEVGEEIFSPEVNQNVQGGDGIRVRFKKDFRDFMEEAEAYVSAVENDKTTMQLFRALDTLGDDLSGLLAQGVQKGRHRFAGLGEWTHWVGWAIPRLMQMVPRGAIPIPSVEIKTKNIEGGLYALFVQGLAGGQGEGGLGTKLTPDEVVVKEWTEVRIDMAERERSLAGPSVQTTSRVHMHLDGVRAKVEGMGYYFKYFGGLVDYEDEGLLSVDVGMGHLHSGLGVDIEVEMENNIVEIGSGVDIDDPEIIIEHEEVTEHTGNRDIQEAVANGGSALKTEREIITIVDSPPEPLFRVVDVKVALAELKFKIDKSRHWILNKLFLQPLAGPMVAHVVRQALEDKIRVGLYDLALNLGAVVKDAKRKGEIRRAKARSRVIQEDTDGIGFVEEDVVEGPREFLTDWWSAILQTGPVVLGYDMNAGDGQGKVMESNTRIDATTKGVIFRTEQPKATPVMVYDKPSGSMKAVSPTLESSSQPHDSEEETVVAIGGSAQLFPGKGAKDQQDVLEGVHDSAIKAVDEVVGEGERIEERWGERKKAEGGSRKTWKSDAFDFQ